MSLTFHPNLNSVQIEVPEDAPGPSSIVKLPDGFDWLADHLLHMESDCGRLRIRIDAAALDLRTKISASFDSLMFTSDEQSIALTGFAMTQGFEDLFEEPELITEIGWRLSGDPDVSSEPGEVLVKTSRDCVLTKGPLAISLEFAANFRFIEGVGEASYGLALNNEDTGSFRFTVDPTRSQLAISDGTSHQLGPGFPFDKYHQLRILKIGRLGFCYLDGVLVGEFEIGDAPSTPAIVCSGAEIGIEMVRVTAI